jgi:hypothetical protein
MKIRFRLSTKDPTCVKVSLKSLDENRFIAWGPFSDELSPGNLELHTEFIMSLDGIRTLFFVDKKGVSATTRTFPRELALPTKGTDVTLEVSTDIYRVR